MADYYKEAIISVTVTSEGIDVVVLMVADE